MVFILMRIILWCTVVLLAGCTAVKLTYNNADTALSWMADDYLALDKPQEKLLRIRLDRLLSWHRANALPEYADTLRTVKSKIAAGLRRDDIVWLIEAGRAEYDEELNRAAVDAVGVLSTVSPRQIDNLEKKLARDDVSFVKEYLRGSPKQEREQRAEKTIARIEHWVGRLSDSQRKKVSEVSFAMPLTYALRRQDRMRKQQEFVAILRDQKNPDQLEASLRQWLKNWQDGKSDEYRGVSNEFEKQSIALVLAVDAMITPAQRAKALARVQNYIDDFEELARDVRTTPSGPVGGASQPAEPTTIPASG